MERHNTSGELEDGMDASITTSEANLEYSYPYHYNDLEADEYTEFVYEGFAFERPIYLFLWEILAVLITISNVLIILMLLKRSLRSSTNVVLIGIAVGETLTVLVTLPAYMYTYQQLQEGEGDSKDAYILSKDWCNVLMLSKFFLSKSFHTITIWLHCFLGFQRLFSVFLPLKSKIYFTINNTLVIITGICICGPLLHIYHVVNFNKAIGGFCEWAIQDQCGGACVYMWFAFLLMHLMPCVLLSLFTAAMLVKLFKSTSAIANTQWMVNRESFARRSEANRNISTVVILVVIALLVPEIPYGIFLIYSAVLSQSNLKLMPLKYNRAFHAAYELLLALSYCAKFWIYVTLNQTFQKEIVKLCNVSKREITHGNVPPYSDHRHCPERRRERDSIRCTLRTSTTSSLLVNQGSTDYTSGVELVNLNMP